MCIFQYIVQTKHESLLELEYKSLERALARALFEIWEVEGCTLNIPVPFVACSLPSISEWIGKCLDYNLTPPLVRTSFNK